MASKLAPVSGVTSEATESTRQAVVLAVTRQDCLNQILLMQPERCRQCTMRFRKTGLLLPFSRDIRAYITPISKLRLEGIASTLTNGYRTHSDIRGKWQLHKTADPLKGWSVEEVLRIGAQHSMCLKTTSMALFTATFSLSSIILSAVVTFSPKTHRTFQFTSKRYLRETVTLIASRYQTS